jgi:hypothetical protein
MKSLSLFLLLNGQFYEEFFNNFDKLTVPQSGN